MMGASDLSTSSALRAVGLDDKYLAQTGHVFLTGIQALVRLPLMQRQRDLEAGLRTAGFVSGYRGSPLGTYDEQLRRAGKLLAEHDIVFSAGVNEDLAATAVFGTQQAEAFGEGRYDGVFAIWYGKGPGVDRSGDALRHGNLAGSSKNGGVLVLTGDDHTCESSTTCHQSEYALVDAMLPVLSPSGVQELMDFGLLGIAMSRFSGCWVGMKCVKDTADASGVVDVGALSAVTLPSIATPIDGLNLRHPDTPHAQEYRLHNAKLDAAKAFARANGIDRIAIDAPQARLGIATHGKSYLDVLQACADLGLSEADLVAQGVRLFKIGMTWPLEPTAAIAFAQGLEEIVVVEEKRGLVESQLKELLYGTPRAPRITGKKGADGRKQFQAELALDSVQIALVLADKLLERRPDDRLARRRDELRVFREPPVGVEAMQRSFYFCSGCPHNTSTVVPEGSRGYAGIGCSWMAQMMDRSTLGYTHMGGEGMAWVGEAPFSKREHVFQNVGDGTYFHSGSLAVRAAVAPRANITYKILFNDAVAMTGGQRHDGELTPQRISWQMFAEGVRRIAVVSDDPGRYDTRGSDVPPDAIESSFALKRDEPSLLKFAPGVTVHHRDELDSVQKELRTVRGVSVLIYDQTCAAEKRRRRKRGEFPDPAKRLFINDLVCEGCGDCGTQSNCVSLVPLETEFGRKRAIDQSSCNKDYSCVKGFCPSFVTVHGGQLRRNNGAAPAEEGALPEPQRPALDGVYSVVVAGVGGTGIVTIGAVLGMAAHLEGRGCGILDMAGLAQKGGSVWSHLRFTPQPGGVKAVRVAPGGADVVLGCDLVVVSSTKTMSLVRPDTAVVINTHEVMPGHFALQPDLAFPSQPMLARVAKAVAGERRWTVDATRHANDRFGDSIAGNMMMLGFAYQKGLLPVSAAAIERAIELNAVAVPFNLEAFRAGRRLAVGQQAAIVASEPVESRSTLDSVVDRRRAFLVDYQDKAYAQRYSRLVEAVRHFETERWGEPAALTDAVARYYFKLLAYKDEYEVARLYAATDFIRNVVGQFDGKVRVAFNLAPPIFSRTDPATGLPKKREFGGWVLWAFKALAAGRRLRGTRWDIFGRTPERRMERELISRYERSIGSILSASGPIDRDSALALARIPESIRGFGHVKQRHVDETLPRWTQLDNSMGRPSIPIRAV